MCWLCCTPKQIFRCFRTLERWGDKITGAAGKYFVIFAAILLSIGIVCFFDVIQPSLPLPILTTPICMLIAENLLVHYYYVCTVPPGYVEDPPRDPGTSIFWAKRPETSRNASENVRITRAAIAKCKRCGIQRPERAHHCRICNHCVLKYDHHCPVGINQCVGIHNERHFILFMVYLVLSTFCFAASGWRQLLGALGMTAQSSWLYRVPELAYILIYILSAVLCIVVGVMLGWHLSSIAAGETSTESQDHEVYSQVARERGEVFVNSYDLGKWTNLQLFFNVGWAEGYSYLTLILPLRVPPYTDGRSWARREGYERHCGIEEGDELTEEDVEQMSD